MRLYDVLSFINARFFGHFHIGQQGIGSALKSEKKYNLENPVTQISLKREKHCFWYFDTSNFNIFHCTFFPLICDPLCNELAGASGTPQSKCLHLWMKQLMLLLLWLWCAVLRTLLPFHLKLVKSGAIFVLEVEQRRDLKSSRSWSVRPSGWLTFGSKHQKIARRGLLL